jgi:aryl-alcohol dehydrogenase-like predicted oxidoreductase
LLDLVPCRVVRRGQGSGVRCPVWVHTVDTAGDCHGGAAHCKPPQSRTRLGEKAERFARFDLERNWKILDAVRGVAVETGSSPSAVSIAWLLARPQVTLVVFGARTVEQLEANLPGAELALTLAQLTALDQASAFDLGSPYSFIQATQASW